MVAVGFDIGKPQGLFQQGRFIIMGKLTQNTVVKLKNLCTIDLSYSPVETNIYTFFHRDLEVAIQQQIISITLTLSKDHHSLK